MKCYNKVVRFNQHERCTYGSKGRTDAKQQKGVEMREGDIVINTRKKEKQGGGKSKL